MSAVSDLIAGARVNSPTLRPRAANTGAPDVPQVEESPQVERLVPIAPERTKAIGLPPPGDGPWC